MPRTSEALTLREAARAVDEQWARDHVYLLVAENVPVSRSALPLFLFFFFNAVS